MSLFNLFGRGSAPIARERLHILLAHERIARSQPDLLGILREEILAVISRHLSFDPDKVQIKMDRGKSVSMLEVEIEIPNVGRASGVVPRHSRLTLDPGRDDSVSAMDQRGL
jgi:cell division topological specificity factor